MNDWYNLEDRDNYEFGSYVVIVETDEDREYHLIDDYDEANAHKLKCENNKKYVYVSNVRKVNKKTNNILMNVRQKDEENNKQKELFYDLVDIYKEP